MLWSSVGEWSRSIRLALGVGEEKIVGERTCAAEDDESCPADFEDHVSSEHPSSLENEWTMAAHYYRIAAEKHKSPRANFNMGFLYEFGLGLKQDFPLAKRHYDLALSTGNSKENGLAVLIALWVMNLHESIIKMQVSWSDWWKSDREESLESVGDSNEKQTASNEKMTYSIIASHILNAEFILLLVTLVMLLWLLSQRI